MMFLILWHGLRKVKNSKIHVETDTFQQIPAALKKERNVLRGTG